MRTPKRVRQKLYYALKGEPQPIYERDEDGNIIYILVGGEEIPKDSGEQTNGIEEPVMIENSIGGNLTQAEIEAFGSQGKDLASMTYRRGEYPFKVGTLIWLNSEIRRLEDGQIDDKSADYVVVGINTTGQFFWRAVLRANARNETD